MFSIERSVRPLPIASRRSTMKTDRPSDFLATSANGVVRANSNIRSEWRTREIQTFWPFTT